MANAQRVEDPSARPYPSQTVRIFTGNEPGTSSDAIARLVAESLEKLWGKPVVTVNRPGAGGIIAAETVARAPADGHTLLLGTHSNLVLAQAVGRELRYDARHDFAPIGRITRVPMALVVAKDLPVHSVAEFIGYAKRRPGKLTYATTGPGTMSQMGVEMLSAATGIDMLAVPYKGTSSALLDVVAGRVDAILTDAVTLAPQIESGALRVLGAAGSQRLTMAPDVATIAEQGVADFEVGGWHGLLAPAETPPEILARLAGALEQVRRMPEFRRRLAQLGCEPIDEPPAQFRAVIQRETDRFAEVARRAGSKDK